MGLDMYLTGRKELWRSARTLDDEGYMTDAVEVKLAYWRKHPNLHGYIVNTFAEGVDDCKPVLLNEDDLRRIVRAIKNDELPHTTGFFFGTSEKSQAQMAEDIAIFEAALKWLDRESSDELRSVLYRASW